MSDIVERLRAACDGHPHAKIEWPHRVLHEAADEIDRLRDMCINREEFIANHNLWREFSQYLSEPHEQTCIRAQQTASPANAGPEGYTEAEGYAASLRQMAQWIILGKADEVDEGELCAAANFIERSGIQPQCAPIPPDTEAELLHSIKLLMDQCEQLRGEYQRGLDDAIKAIRAGRDDWSSGEDIGKTINWILGVAEGRIADLSRTTSAHTRPDNPPQQMPDAKAGWRAMRDELIKLGHGGLPVSDFRAAFESGLAAALTSPECGNTPEGK